MVQPPLPQYTTDSTSRCRDSEDLCDVRLPSVSWLASASFSCHYSLQNRLFQPIVPLNVAKIYTDHKFYEHFEQFAQHNYVSTIMSNIFDRNTL